MDFVDYVKSKCAECGIHSAQVHTAELVTLEFVDEGEPVTVTIVPRGETLHGEKVIQLSTEVMSPPDDVGDSAALAEFLLILNGTSQMFFWGLAGTGAERYFTAYARLITNSTTKHSFEVAVVEIVGAKRVLREQLDALAEFEAES